MYSNNHRILLHLTMTSKDDASATKSVDATYFRINNILCGNAQLPNIENICDYCNDVNQQLGAYIRNRCLDIRKEDSIFDPESQKPNAILNGIESSARKQLRIVLYPGNRDDINEFKVNEATHNMIVQFDKDAPNFRATEPHTNPPSFYQVCPSEKVALLYLEALLVDACVCHYLGVSDVAYYHDQKQRISSEKVLFLRYLATSKDLKTLTPAAQNLIKHVASQLIGTTPYISFLSIFTIASLDVLKESFNDAELYFEDYCKLWGMFQKWYFGRHGRLFSKSRNVGDPVNQIFERNKYQGQISPSEIASKIEQLLDEPHSVIKNSPFGEECRYAVVIIKHVPDNTSIAKEFEALFSGQIHQAKWDIVYWGDMEKYDNILPYLEVVPFIIIIEE